LPGKTDNVLFAEAYPYETANNHQKILFLMDPHPFRPDEEYVFRQFYVFRTDTVCGYPGSRL